MRPRTEDIDWKALGAKCVKFRPFRPKDGGIDDIEDPWFNPGDYEDAKAICNGTYDGKVCPARDTCLAYAAINNEAFGVWGGMDELERRIMRRLMRAKYRRRPDKVPIEEWTWERQKPAVDRVLRLLEASQNGLS